MSGSGNRIGCWIGDVYYMRDTLLVMHLNLMIEDVKTYQNTAGTIVHPQCMLDRSLKELSVQERLRQPSDPHENMGLRIAKSPVS